jgi:hypothetical protein
MELKQVLSLSLFLVENELSEDKESTSVWRGELKAARQTLKEELKKYQKPAGRFFVSANTKPKALNGVNKRSKRT